MLIKLLDVRDKYEAKGSEAALKYLARTPKVAGIEKDTISKAAGALNNPQFYRELGFDPASLVISGTAALMRLIYPSQESVVAKATATSKPVPKAKPKAKVKQPEGSTGTKVGYEAKCLVDCKWNASRCAFYKALRKIGGEGTGKQISEATDGEVAVGNCLHYGYHGVAPGLNKVEQREEHRGFVFVLTAKGRSIDLEKQLIKKPAVKEKAPPKKKPVKPVKPLKLVLVEDAA